MNKTTLKVSILIIGLLVFQCGIPTSFIPNQATENSYLTATVNAIQLPVNDFLIFELNDSYTSESIEISITEPGIYGLNLSWFVEEGQPPGVDLGADFYQSIGYYIPGMGVYLQAQQSLASPNWNNRLTNATYSYDLEVIAVRTGYLRVDFEMTDYNLGDWVSANLTVSQEFLFASSPNAMPLGQNSTLEWTEDNTWQGLRVNLPTDNFYNFTTYAGLNWNTTAGYSGESLAPVDLALIDLEYGEYYTYNYWSPTHSIPAGPSINSSVIGPMIELDVLKGGDYYLIGKSDEFTYLNSSIANFTLNVFPVPAQPLLPNQPLELHFNTTPNVLYNYIAVTIPEGHYFDAYFSSPIGANWTVWGEDAWTGSFTGPYFETYEDPTTIYNESETLEHGWATTIGMGTPMPALLGNYYIEEWSAQATYTVYINGTKVTAIPPGGMSATSRFNTFYFRVEAAPTDPDHSTTFNLTANFFISPFPQLTTSGLTFEFNSTVGPFYHLFAIPEASGVIYETSAIASNYNTSGTIRIEDMEQPGAYLDWEWMAMLAPPLAIADPATGPGASQNVNDTATLTYVAVRDRMNYLWVLGPGMIGGDMTACNVSLSITPPSPYQPGTIASVTVHDSEFACFTFNVIAGNNYLFNMELSIDGDIAYGYFIDVFGTTPFVISSIYQFFIVAAPSIPYSRIFTATYTARYSGRVTFIVLGEGTVYFSIGLLEPPLSLTTIGIIIATAIIMTIVGILIGYLIFKRRIISR